jgi:type IV pilus modification protein PilV
MSSDAKLKRARLKLQAGISLIEVMASMVILSIGLLGAAQMIPLALAGVSQAGVRTNAVQAAQQQLDSLKSQEYSSAALTAGTYSQTVDGYTLSWTIRDDNPVPGSKRIDLNTSWQTVTGTQDATFSTCLSRSR